MYSNLLEPTLGLPFQGPFHEDPRPITKSLRLFCSSMTEPGEILSQGSDSTLTPVQQSVSEL